MSRALLIVMACLVVAASASLFDKTSGRTHPTRKMSTKVPTEVPAVFKDASAKLTMPFHPRKKLFGDLSKVTPTPTGRRLDEECAAEEIVIAVAADTVPDQDQLLYLCGDSDCQDELVDLADGEMSSDDLALLCNLMMDCDMNFTEVMMTFEQELDTEGAFHEHPLCDSGTCGETMRGFMMTMAECEEDDDDCEPMTDDDMEEAEAQVGAMCGLSEGCGSLGVMEMDFDDMDGPFHEHEICAEDTCLPAIVEVMALMEGMNETTAVMMATYLGAMCDLSEYECMDDDGEFDLEGICAGDDDDAGVCAAVMATMAAQAGGVSEEEVYAELAFMCFGITCEEDYTNMIDIFVNGNNDTATEDYPCLEAGFDANWETEEEGCDAVPELLDYVGDCDECVQGSLTFLAYTFLCEEGEFDEEEAMEAFTDAFGADYAPEVTQSDRAAAIEVAAGGGGSGGGSGGTAEGEQDTLGRAAHATLSTLALLAAALLAAI